MIGILHKRLRNICSSSVHSQNIELGGRNKVVEIDESLFAKVQC